MANITKAFKEKKKYTLSDIGYLFRGHQCTDPRDTIHGLLSICKEAHQFTVDYDCAVEELFVQALRVCSDEMEPSATSTKDCHQLMRMLKTNLSSCLMYGERRACALPSCLDDEIHLSWTSSSADYEYSIMGSVSGEVCPSWVCPHWYTHLTIGSTTCCLQGRLRY